MAKPVQFNLSSGIISNFPPSAVRENGLQECRNVNHDERYGTVGKIRGSVAKSVQLPAPVTSLHEYPHFNLEGQQQLDAIAVARGDLHVIHEGGTLDIYTAGLGDEDVASIMADDLIYFANRYGDPVKFDGHSVTRWGVVAPGEEAVVIDPIDDHGDYTVAPATAGVIEAATDPDGPRGGGPCVAVRSTGNTERQITLSKTVNFNIHPYGRRLSVWLFIPPGGLEELSRTGWAAQVVVGTFLEGSNTYSVAAGGLFEGWNELAWEEPTLTTGTPNLYNINLVQLILHFRNTFTGWFKWSSARTFRDDRTTASIIGDGGVRGVVRYVTVYVSKYGQRSNAGPASEPIDAGEGSALVVSNIPISSDPQVTQRLVFRDQDGDQQWLLVARIEDPTTTFFYDSIDPNARGIESPPLAGDGEIDNSPAPRMSDVVIYEGHAFAIDADRRFMLHITPPHQIESWPILNRQLFDNGLTAIVPHRLGLLFYTSQKDKTYLMTGKTLSEFRWEPWNPERAAAGRRVAVTLKTFAFYLSSDGPYIDDGSDPWYAGSVVWNRWREEIDLECLCDDSFILHCPSLQQILCFLRDKQGQQSIWIYEYGKTSAGQVTTEGGIDARDVRIGNWIQMRLPAGVEATCGVVLERIRGVPEVWIGASDGYVYSIFDPASSVYATSPTTSVPIEAMLQTGRAPMIDSFRWGRPSWVTIEAQAPNFTVWRCTVTAYEGATAEPRKSSSFNVAIGPGKTSIRRRIPGARALRGSWFDVKLEHDREEHGGTIDLLQVEVLADRVRQRGALS